MSFVPGLPMFEIVRLLQSKEDYDIFDFSDSRKGLCSFYGRKEVFAWFVSQSRDFGYQKTPEEQVQLALNVARNTQHNGAELVKVALEKVSPQAALEVKDADGVTLLHRVAARLSCSFACEHAHTERFTRFLNEGIDPPKHPSDMERCSRNAWILFLRSLSVTKGVDLNAISNSEDAPMTTGTPMTTSLRPLVGFWNGSSPKLILALPSFLQLWLSELSCLGVNILRYGEEEKRLQDGDFVIKDFKFHRREKNLMSITTRTMKVAHGTLRVINFKPNISPHLWKFWWSEPTDEFLGEFWAMCERLPTKIPGAWDDPSELL